MKEFYYIQRLDGSWYRRLDNIRWWEGWLHPDMRGHTICERERSHNQRWKGSIHRKIGGLLCFCKMFLMSDKQNKSIFMHSRYWKMNSQMGFPEIGIVLRWYSLRLLPQNYPNMQVLQLVVFSDGDNAKEDELNL